MRRGSVEKVSSSWKWGGVVVRAEGDPTPKWRTGRVKNGNTGDGVGGEETEGVRDDHLSIG